MSFAVADLMVQLVIEDGLKNLNDNPHHLEYILSRYCQIDALWHKVGDKYIKQAMEMILNTKILVRPFYVMDQDQYPNVVLASSYSESQQYMGDYGHLETSEIITQPIVYAKFDLKGLDKNCAKISKDYKIENKIWTGIKITNGVEVVKVTGIALSEGDTVLFLDKELPEGTALRGWEAKTFAENKTAVIHASTDAVTVQAKLASSGDPDVHRLLSTVIRYCLKRGRQRLEGLGFQNARISQTPMSVTEQEDGIIETVFTIEGQIHDSWIDREFESVQRMEVVPELESTLNSEGNKAKVRF